MHQQMIVTNRSKTVSMKDCNISLARPINMTLLSLLGDLKAQTGDDNTEYEHHVQTWHARVE